MTDAEGNEIGKVFIGGLSQTTNDDSLRNYFDQFGSIEDCVVMMDNKTGRSRGFGYIKFHEESTVRTVLEEGPHLLDGKIVDVKQCNIHMKGRNRRSLKIFVGGIGLDDNEETIRQFFSQFGNVTDVNLMLDQTKQRHRGFAFVGFDDESVVKELIVRHFVTMNGKHVEIKAMEPPNFARKLVSAESNSTNSLINNTSTVPGMILCNPLSSDSMNSEEKMLRLAPQYSLQPLIWSNTSNHVANSSGVWANPYQFDKIPPNCLYQQPSVSCPHFHQCLPNPNQTMWGMMPPQSPSPWGYQVPLNNNPIYQYTPVPSNTWQYPYLFQYAPQVKSPLTCNAEKSNAVDPQDISKHTNSNINHRNDENRQNIINDSNQEIMSQGYDPQNDCWIYNNKEMNKMNMNSQIAEPVLQPNGDENLKMSYNSQLADFNFFQSSY